MPSSVGIDIVFIPKLKKMSAESLEQAFLPHELKDGRPEHLAGIWAAKEAFFKAIGRKTDWQSVWIEYEASGRPRLKSDLLPSEQEADVSISHDGDYVIAIVNISDKTQK